MAEYKIQYKVEADYRLEFNTITHETDPETGNWLFRGGYFQRDGLFTRDATFERS